MEEGCSLCQTAKAERKGDRLRASKYSDLILFKLSNLLLVLALADTIKARDCTQITLPDAGWYKEGQRMDLG